MGGPDRLAHTVEWTRSEDARGATLAQIGRFATAARASSDAYGSTGSLKNAFCM